MSETIMRPAKDTAFARFFHQAVENKAESKKKGRPIYDNVEFIEITKPNDKHTKLVEPATDAYRTRFAHAYAHFKATQERPDEGTPLRVVPIFTPADIATLAAMEITTLEKFAGLQTDDVPPEFRDLHREALRYLDAANDKGTLARKCAKLEEDLGIFRKENEDLKAELKQANAELKALKTGKAA